MGPVPDLDVDVEVEGLDREEGELLALGIDGFLVQLEHGGAVLEVLPLEEAPALGAHLVLVLFEVLELKHDGAPRRDGLEALRHLDGLVEDKVLCLVLLGRARVDLHPRDLSPGHDVGGDCWVDELQVLVLEANLAHLESHGARVGLGLVRRPRAVGGPEEALSLAIVGVVLVLVVAANDGLHHVLPPLLERLGVAPPPRDPCLWRQA
mmetsp:Transcript_12276/g.31718  ORF Transcript_12276/g.31718 Transcript_12276/m.31718 type:complete len:208 (+) Transcript_12276:200-823(+)